MLGRMWGRMWGRMLGPMWGQFHSSVHSACREENRHKVIIRRKSKRVTGLYLKMLFTSSKSKRLCRCRVNWSKLKSLQVYVVPIQTRLQPETLIFY